MMHSVFMIIKELFLYVPWGWAILGFVTLQFFPVSVLPSLYIDYLGILSVVTILPSIHPASVELSKFPFLIMSPTVFSGSK